MGINTLLSPVFREKKQTELKIQTIDQTAAEPEDELYSLDSRIFKRDITPVISHIFHVVLLPKH